MTKVPGGFFITIEGVDGTGKSTQARLLVDHLKGMGFPVTVSREPGGTEIGRHIRALLLDPAFSEMSVVCEALLYAADRAQNVAQVIKPALARGEVVVSERFVDSSVVYQGYGHDVHGTGEPVELVTRINEVAAQGCTPHLTLLFDIAPQEGLTRVETRAATSPERPGAAGPDRIEKREMSYFQRVRRGYLELARKHPSRIKVVEVQGRDEQDIHGEVAKIVGEALRARLSGARPGTEA